MTSLDVTTAFRGPGRRLELVRAVCDGDSTLLETDWLEWKSMVELDTKAWQGEIATHVVGFANREPLRAARVAEGHAYLLLGIEPANVVGVQTVDPAALEDWIARYTGRSEGPRWEPHYVAIDDKHVLVVEVDGPRDGDPVYSLRKEFTDPAGHTIADGTVFVRRVGKTARARSADYDALNRRVAQPKKGLDVSLTWWEERLPIRPLQLDQAAQESWLAREAARLLKPLEPSADTPPVMARAFSMSVGENRTEEAYREQVDNYLTAARSALPGYARAKAVAKGIGAIELAVENPTEHNFEQLAVELFVPGDLAAFFDLDEAAEAAAFPDVPLLWNTKRSLFPTFDVPRIAAPTIRQPRTGYIDNSGSARIKFPPLHVRPLHRHALEQVHLVVDAEHAGDAIEASWTASATNVSGTDHGELQLQIAPQQHALDDVLG